MSLILNSDIKYNKNDIDKLQLHNVKHYIGIDFPPIPFLWNYNDFAQPYPIYGISKIGVTKFLEILTKFKPNDKLNDNIKGLNDINTDFYINIQYKKELYWYSEEVANLPNDIYISYHTWMHINHTKQYNIQNYNKYNSVYEFLTGLYSLEGNITTNEFFPFKVKKNGNKIPAGINIDDNLDKRCGTIHKHKGIIKFSGKDVCNFNGNETNLVFVSIMKSPFLILKNNNGNRLCPIMTTNNVNPNKRCCIVLHLFRNIYDNNPESDDFQEVIKKIDI